MTATLSHVFTIRDAMITSDVKDADLINDQSSAERLAEDMFDDNFLTCTNKSQADVEADFKSISSLTVA